ncbi:mitochondrial ATPase inhibitor, IATP-domain-containing protein [Fusarium tricinctum]|uniref:ATPase inhibitor, mitochondrial n=2 Tax=Fusarium tricinctum species complex TaxID=679429 RepID=A0A8K0WDH5_9HYPO|nr:mitochondrial ATPase inhibitor, IATP-domain-containing protein [Fusarium tricinctum]
MLRTTFRQTAAFRPVRCFSTTPRVMTEGATGAPRPTGGSGDAFQRREKASEDYAIRQREKEKLIELKKKLQEQQQHLDRLSKHMYDTQSLARCSSIPIESTTNSYSFSDEITKEQGEQK